MRMGNWFGLAAAVAALAITASAADVNGKWTGQMPGQGGQTREVTFTFKADSNALTGSMALPQAEFPIKESKVSGNDISFKVPVEFGGNSFMLLFKGAVSGDQIKFTRTREGGGGQAQEFTAKRAN